MLQVSPNSHARKRPPLPLRFAIYRKDLRDLNKEASSQHPFFLYSLKECLISAVADDFGLRHELDRNNLWSEFEARVVECCDRMIRPYSCIAPVVSARMLLSRRFCLLCPCAGNFSSSKSEKRGKRCHASLECAGDAGQNCTGCDKARGKVAQTTKGETTQWTNGACRRVQGMGRGFQGRKSGRHAAFVLQSGTSSNALSFLANSYSSSRTSRTGAARPRAKGGNTRVRTLPLGAICGAQCRREEMRSPR